GRGVYWEAESGRVISPIIRDSDPKAFGGAFVWMPARPGEKASSSVGYVTWRLNVEKPGRYSLWGRVLAPTPSNDSFYVRVFNNKNEILVRTDWPTGVRKDWQWVPFVSGGKGEPVPLDLPSGTVCIQLRVREAGAKMDRLYVTPCSGDRRG
ncbi:MAG: hypothetical protein N3B01_12640, partial [Verrucomicrobiae bacterium]|nr:hypothetical protein [Verrucomicrobiae bacterium]